MNCIYMVSHLDPKNEDEKHIGSYLTYDEAAKVVEKYKKFEGFKDAPDCFYIDKYELNKLYWAEGYYNVNIKVKKNKS